MTTNPQNEYALIEVLEEIFRKDRFHVKLKFPDGSEKIKPRYIYVWLKHNPSFIDIPKGYVIHHLDHNKINDDPSNLVVMQKYHHIAYHFKSIIITPKLAIDEASFRKGFKEYQPTQKPRSRQVPNADRWYVDFYQRDELDKLTRQKSIKEMVKQ